MRIKDEAKIAKRKELILHAARSIMEEEGLEAVSIRRIASMIQQTPGIIYHYFPSKEELMLAVVQDGYQNILQILQTSYCADDRPSIQLYKTLKAYLLSMLQDPLLYQVIMQSKVSSVQEQTNILVEGLRQDRTSIQMLCNCLEEGIRQKEFVLEHVEVRAQCIWCCIYGLLERIIIEQPSKEYRKRIIEEMLELILASLRRTI